MAKKVTITKAHFDEYMDLKQQRADLESGVDKMMLILAELEKRLTPNEMLKVEAKIEELWDG